LFTGICTEPSRSIYGVIVATLGSTAYHWGTFIVPEIEAKDILTPFSFLMNRKFKLSV
jgi:hypothetical protein